MSKKIACSLLGAAALALLPSVASAATNCNFVTVSSSMKLQASCSTDAAIVIPSGKTLDGQGFKITAIDPPGGTFKGPILTNVPLKIANVSNLYLRTNLADVCNDPADQVVGILINNGTSTISGVNITINKAAGASACAEGVAVVGQKLPYNSKGTFNKVTVKNSTLNYNQLGGLLASGNVSFRAEKNLIKNNLANPNVAQYGIRLENGVKGYLLSNEVLRHTHVPMNGEPAHGIVLDGAGVSTVLTNTVSNNDIGIRLIGVSKSGVRSNVLRTNTLDGILLDDSNGLPVTGNSVLANDSQKSGRNGISLDQVNGKLTKNYVKTNISNKNTEFGISVEGSLNQLQSNTATQNVVLDIFDGGTGDTYSRNLCNTSSGPPVDCPVAPLP